MLINSIARLNFSAMVNATSLFSPDFLDKVAEEIVVTLVVTAILAALGVIFRRQWKMWLRKAKLYFSDKQIKMKAFAVAKFDSPPTKDLDNAIFKEIQSQITNDNFSSQTVTPRFLRMRSDNLGMSISISIEEEPDTATLSEGKLEILSYNIVVRMEAEIRGVKQIDVVQDFINICDKSIRIIQRNCFSSSERSYFVVCDVRDAIDEPKNKELSDWKLGATISYHDTILTIISNEPAHLVRTIKKYVYSS
ncbi:MAG: hypothetical protein ACRD5H_19225 [Nitrososphaerales archaeon]